MTESTLLPAGPATPEGFRAVMQAFPTGVAILTATDALGRPWGMTCSSLCSVSLQPPTLLVCMRTGSPTLAAAQVSGTFALNLLHDGAEETAELFASGRLDRFDHVKWHLEVGAGGPHLPDVAHALADCRVARTLPVGDHVVIVGETYRVARSETCRPLLRGMRMYSRWPSQ
jgi:flavin reductase (DIM6/NTAB) family NADH-FMN oxidoreductase RutF